MKVFNIRYGFATNSSSSHSIIMGKGLKDRLVDDCEFGWDAFIAVSENAERNYLAEIVYENLIAPAYNYSEDFANRIVTALTGIRREENNYEDRGLDHASVITIPREYGHNHIDINFFRDLQNFILTPGIVILGGSDNVDYDYKKEIEKILPSDTKTIGVFLNFLKDRCPNDFVCRWDKVYKYWTVFDKKYGTKVRMVFSDDVKVPEQASTPELVDIKITDYCVKNCNYCYQDSSIEGKHCDWEDVKHHILYELRSMKVFEVAVGGGEPTAHPQFIDILQDIKNAGIIPNFSTRNLEWLDNEYQRTQILSLIGGFAYSITTLEDIAELKEYYYKFRDELSSKVKIQYVMGLGIGIRKLLDTVYKLSIPITFLGWKSKGRGKGDLQALEQEKKEFDALCDAICKDKKALPTIGIDTCLADKYLLQLQELGIPEYLYDIKDGKFSMYIDLVDMQAGRSSYCSDEEMVTVNNDSDLQKIFNGFRESE